MNPNIIDVAKEQSETILATAELMKREGLHRDTFQLVVSSSFKVVISLLLEILSQRKNE